MTIQFKRLLPFGANLIAEKRTRFRLFAPAQRSVSVEIEGAAPIAMAPSGLIA